MLFMHFLKSFNLSFLQVALCFILILNYLLVFGNLKSLLLQINHLWLLKCFHLVEQLKLVLLRRTLVQAHRVCLKAALGSIFEDLISS